MKLKLKNVKNYAIALEKVNDRRNRITVSELTADSFFTGRSWDLTYDPLITGSKELSGRIDAQILGEAPPTPEIQPESVDGHTEAIAMVIVPILSVAINKGVTESALRTVKSLRGEAVEPEQVLIERVYESAVGKLTSKLPAVVARITTGSEPVGSPGRGSWFTRFFRRWIHA